MANKQKYITTGRWTLVGAFLALNDMTHSQLAKCVDTGRGAISSAVKAGHVVVINSCGKLCILPHRYIEAFE